MTKEPESLLATVNEPVQIAAPEGHETGGLVEVTFWSDGIVRIKLLDGQGRLKVAGIELDACEFDLQLARDW